MTGPSTVTLSCLASFRITSASATAHMPRFAALEGIAFAPSLGFLRGAILLLGFGGGLMNGGTNALVADISERDKVYSVSLE